MTHTKKRWSSSQNKRKERKDLCMLPTDWMSICVCLCSLRRLLEFSVCCWWGMEAHFLCRHIIFLATPMPWSNSFIIYLPAAAAYCLLLVLPAYVCVWGGMQNGPDLKFLLLLRDQDIRAFHKYTMWSRAISSPFHHRPCSLPHLPPLTYIHTYT